MSACLRGSAWGAGHLDIDGYADAAVAVTLSKEATPNTRASLRWPSIGFRIASEHPRECVYNEGGDRSER